MENKFQKLILENKGFEYILGFVENEDHCIGGTGNQVWYCVTRGQKQECWMAVLAGDSWKDLHVVVNGKKVSEEAAEPGTAMQMILDRAYFYQSEIEASGRNPVMTEVGGFPVKHYTYSFGETAYDISEDYGVTLAYSNINDISVGFRVRNIFTSDDVKSPKF